MKVDSRALALCSLALTLARADSTEPVDPSVDQNTQDYYLGYKGSDYDTPWAKDYNDSTIVLSEAFLQGLQESPVAPALGLPFEDAPAALSQPGYLPLENGYTILDDGTLQLSILTNVPSNFTGEMYDFWFSWHVNSTTKYKLWNPGQHQYSAVNPQDIAGDAAKSSYRDRYWNLTYYVDEYIGSTPYKISLGFYDPRIQNFTLEDATTGIQTIVTAYITIFVYTEEDPASMAAQGLQTTNVVLAHQVRSKPDGSGNEIRSRFWFGNGITAAMRLIMDPLQLGHDLSVHCAREMTHLGSFLPALFNEFKDDIPVGV